MEEIVPVCKLRNPRSGEWEPDLTNIARWRRALYYLLQHARPDLVENLKVSNDSWQRGPTGSPQDQRESGERVRWLHSSVPQAHLVDRLLFDYPSLVKRRTVPVKDRLRTLWVADDVLGTVLQAVRRQVLSGYPLPGAMHGYVRGRSIVTCARTHLRGRYLISLDLADAFETHGRAMDGIKRLCAYKGYQVSGLPEVLRALVAPNRACPRGFCTSPMLFNLAMVDLVEEMQCWCDRFGWTLTVYADNIYLSRPRLAGVDADCTIRTVQRIIETYGWKVNDRKTSFTDQVRHGSLQLLGLVIKDGALALSHERLREIRRQLWQLVHDLQQDVDTEERARLLGRYGGIMQLPYQVYGVALPHLFDAPLAEFDRLT